MPATVKGWCIHCRGVLDLPPDRPEALVECPYCGRRVFGGMAVSYRHEFHRTKKRIWMAVGLVFLLAAAWLGWKFRTRFTSGFDLLAEATGSNASAAWTLAGVLLILGVVLVWILFPILMFFTLLGLQKRTTELEELMKLNVRHLARVSADVKAGSDKAVFQPAEDRPRPEEGT